MRKMLFEQLTESHMRPDSFLEAELGFTRYNFLHPRTVMILNNAKQFQISFSSLLPSLGTRPVLWLAATQDSKASAFSNHIEKETRKRVQNLPRKSVSPTSFSVYKC